LNLAGQDEPEQAPAGLVYGIVHGQFAVRDSASTGARAGQVLRAR